MCRWKRAAYPPTNVTDAFQKKCRSQASAGSTSEATYMILLWRQWGRKRAAGPKLGLWTLALPISFDGSSAVQRNRTIPPSRLVAGGKFRKTIFEKLSDCSVDNVTRDGIPAHRIVHIWRPSCASSNKSSSFCSAPVHIWAGLEQNAARGIASLRP
jgi:hypothetical protein